VLTAVIIAKNEQENLGRCLDSLRFCEEIIVIDDHSTDDTAKIAKSAGARVIQHSLENDYAAQRNFALPHIKTTWTLFVDADETVSPELAAEILRAIPSASDNGFMIPRVDWMWGKKLSHGDTGSVKLLRLGKTAAGQWHGKVHETWHIPGPIGELNNRLNHYPHPTVSDFLHHINIYSSIRARELYNEKKKTNALEIIFLPVLKFKYLYLFKLGFLDGTPGFIHAMIMSFYTFLVRGKLFLLYKGIS